MVTKEPRVPNADFGPETVRNDAHGEHHDRERRLALLIARLPARVQAVVRRLRQPSMRWLRIPAGLLLILGGLISILPLFGLWMLPLGLVLLAEDVPRLRRATGRVLAWIEHHRPHWMGLSAAPPEDAAQFRPAPFDPPQTGKQER